MRAAISLILLLMAITCAGQDRVYFLDGEIKEGKVMEVTPDDIVFSLPGGEETIPKSTVYFLLLADGSRELLNRPAKDLIKENGNGKNLLRTKEAALEQNNTIAINTVALMNADLSIFYERLVLKKKAGLGIMGAYNFNRTALLYNSFIAILNNAKKRSDLGVFANYYFRGSESRKTLYIGLMLKHTSFSFSRVLEDTVWNGNQMSVNLQYRPAQGSQLATMFTIGSQHNISSEFFIRSIFSFGGFNVKGVYREQLERSLNAGTTTPGTRVSVGFLPKLYIGLNAGLKF